MIQREHILQSKLPSVCAKVVACEHMFVSYDRTQPRSEFDHIYQARRGIRRSIPDTDLLLDGGKSFRCEIKRPGVRLEEGSAQEEMLIKLNLLGHKASWANSITMYCEEAERHGVPLRGNWRTVAQIADQQVLAEIRRQELKQAQTSAVTGAAPLVVPRNKPTNPDAQLVKPRPKVPRKHTPNQIRKFEAARMGTLPR